jgi:hypothetical protein
MLASRAQTVEDRFTIWVGEEKRIDYFVAAQQKQGVVISLSACLSVDKKQYLGLLQVLRECK